MDIYLPIAGLSVNALVIVGLGGLVGLLTGMVGVGGGFLTTPILIFYGIPPAVAVASATTQITGTSISGVLAHRRRRGVDVQMGAVIIAGGVARLDRRRPDLPAAPADGPDRYRHLDPLRHPAGQHRLPDGEGGGDRARASSSRRGARRTGRPGATIR